jgi:hypothetical protein
MTVPHLTLISRSRLRDAVFGSVEVRDDLSDVSVIVPGLVAAICTQERLPEFEFNSGELSGRVLPYLA